MKLFPSHCFSPKIQKKKKIKKKTSSSSSSSSSKSSKSSKSSWGFVTLPLKTKTKTKNELFNRNRNLKRIMDTNQLIETDFESSSSSSSTTTTTTTPSDEEEDIHLHHLNEEQPPPPPPPPIQLNRNPFFVQNRVNGNHPLPTTLEKTGTTLTLNPTTPTKRLLPSSTSSPTTTSLVPSSSSLLHHLQSCFTTLPSSLLLPFTTPTPFIRLTSPCLLCRLPTQSSLWTRRP
ncbi:hypothetical protein HMI54_006389 [Coelomomyces lativittatus]|nr:hypothetical protein HMI54_006389 [Coelomomyces lativittatus]